jgi:hypothetical protein
MTVDPVIPTSPTRSVTWDAFNGGITNAVAQATLLTDVLAKVTEAQTQVQELSNAANTWKLSDWTGNQSVAMLKSAFLDKYGIAHPVDSAQAASATLVNFGTGNPPATMQNQTLAWSTDNAVGINWSAPGGPGGFTFVGIMQDDPARTWDDQFPTNTLYKFTDGVYAFKASDDVWYKVNSPDLTTYLQRAPTADELAQWIKDMQSAGVQRTQLSTATLVQVQQVVANKSNWELYCSNIVQRWGSLTDEIARRME